MEASKHRVVAEAYIKIHFMVDVKIKEVLSMHITTDDAHNSEASPYLVMEASKHRVIVKAYMEGAYD